MMLAGVDAELAQFCAPWLAREPRLLLACQFAPAGAPRARLLASCVLARELAEAAMTVSDRRIAEAKLGWWAEESAAWGAGRPRHPLARGFDPQGGAHALAALTLASREWLDAPPAESVESLLQQMRVFAAVSAGLDGCGCVDHWSSLWLAIVLRLSLDARAALTSVLPLDLMARHGLRRSQWSELDAAQRLPALADLAQRLPTADAIADDPGLAAMVVLERRWLQRLSRTGADRVGFLDVVAAWQAGRAAVRVGSRASGP